jgi:hypothetical protein
MNAVCSCFRWRVVALLATAALGLAAFAEEPPGDPLPLNRVPVTQDQVPQLLKQGPLVQMPRAEFDQLLRDAAQKSADAKNPPRLVGALYRATLQNEPALVGSGQWKTINPAGGPALLPLSPLNLALRQARFENPDGDGKPDALIAEFDGRSPALLLEHPGGHKTVLLDWSARAEVRPEGLRFALDFPPAPIAVLELNVPADRVVSAGVGVAVSGPHPAEADNRRLWKISCSNKPGVDLWVRRAADAADGPPLVFVRQETTQKLAPEGMEALFQFELEAVRPGACVLDFEFDADLRPCEVAGADVESWQVNAGLPGQPARLVVRLRRPLADETETVAVRCLAPLGNSIKFGARQELRVAWTSPGMRLLQAAASAGAPEQAGRVLSRGETLKVLVHPAVRLEGWQPGTFRSGEPAKPGADEPGPFQTLTLRGGGVEPEGGAKRPSARLLAGGVEFRARQAAWWELDKSLLTLQLTYEVTHGELFQLAVQLPAGWDIEGLDMPADLLRTWNVRPDFPDKGKSTLLVDLQKPLTPEDTKHSRPPGGGRPRGPTLTVRLHSTQPANLTGREMPFPDAVPLGARYREGSLAIDFDEQTYEHVAKASAPETEADEDGPWGRQTPDLYYIYRGQPVTGTLLLRARPPRVRAKCSSEVYLTSGRAAVETRLLIEAETGGIETIEVHSSAAGVEDWAWRVEQGDNQVRAVKRIGGRQETCDLAGLAALAQPLDAAALAGAWPQGGKWRITLARPLSLRSPLVLRAVRKLDPAAARWDVPLLSVPAAVRMEGEATLHLTGGDRMQVDSAGLRDAPATGGPARGRSGPWRKYRYAEGPVWLTLRGQGRAADRAAAVFDEAKLTTSAAADGSLQAHFQFRASHWPRRTLPVTLPPGAKPVAARADGRWLTRLTLADGDTVLELPVPAQDGLTAGEATHLFEMVYTLPARGTFPWERAASPPPQLPDSQLPIQFRQSWRLPPGVRPVESNYRPLPGSGEVSDVAGWQARLAARMPSAIARAWHEDDDDPPALWQALADGSQAARKERGGQTLPLRELLDMIQAQTGKEVRGFVLDTAALDEAGVGPETKVKVLPLTSGQDQSPPWESLGLVALPARGAMLLTTRRQHSAWGAGPRAPAAVEAAADEAAANGRDATGRFVLSLEWPTDADGAPGTVAGVLSPEAALSDWTEWEALPGADPAAGIILVSDRTIAAAGLALAALLCAAFWLLRRRAARARLTFLLVWLGAAGVAVAWLPAPLRPLALWALPPACVLALGWYLLALYRQAPRKAPATVVAAAAASSMLVALVHLPKPARAQQPAAQTVYILPGPADDPEKETVLVAPKLLEQVQGMARPAFLASGGAVLLSGSYDGRIVEGMAEFDAVYQAFCLTKEPAALTIPLDAVLVGDVWLDGGRAFPTALAPPQVGYTLKLAGRGVHKIELKFRTPVNRSGADRDVQFAAPRLVQSRLHMELPAAAAYVQATSRCGIETTAAAATAATLDADLGRLGGTVQLHWFQETLPPAPVKVQYREAYVWDLRSDAASLTGLVQFDVTQGGALTLDVALPPELEVRRVEPRRPGGGGALRLQNWRVRTGDDGARSLRLRFPSPVSGEVLVSLELVPVAPLTPATSLPLPTPQGTRAATDGGFLAYRAQGLDVSRVPPLPLFTAIKPEAFAPFWPEASRPNPAALTYCAAFRRDKTTPAALRVQLRPPPAALQAVQELNLARVDTRLARFRANVELTTPANDLAFVEWALESPQPLTISAVAGPNVRSWSQADNRLLVWLEKTGAPKVEVEILGWLPLAQPKEGPRLVLPCLRVLGAQAQQTTVRVAASAGLALSSPDLRNLLPAPGQQPSDPELTFTSKSPSYGGSFTVRSAVATADVQILTFVETIDRKVRFKTTVDYRPQRGEMRSVQVRLRDWEAEDVTLTADKAVQQRERRRAPDDRTWTLDLPPGFHEPFRATLTGTIPVDEVIGGLAAPNVTAGAAARVERWLAVAGPDLGVEGVFGLTEVTNYDRALAQWPGEADRLRRAGGQVWKVSADGSLRLVPRDRGAEAAPIRVLASEHSAAVTDNQRWLHEGVFWLRHDGPTDLNLTLPAPARVVAVSLDGVESPPLQPEAVRLWLPLPAVAGIRCLRVRWMYDPPERLDRPNLDAPTIDGAEAAPCLWTVFVPEDFRAGDACGLKQGLGAAAAADLRRAEVQLQITRLLAGQSPFNPASAPLVTAQRRFADLCRRAERALETAGESSGETGPGKVTLRDWLQQLRAQNRELAQKHHFDEVRADGHGEELTRRGVPMYLSDPDAPAPRLQLTAESTRREKAAWLSSIGWLAGVLLVWSLSYFPTLLIWCRRFVPEQFALAGGAAWLLPAPLLVVVSLLLIAVLARGLIVGRRLSARLLRPAVPSAATSVKTGSSNLPSIP